MKGGSTLGMFRLKAAKKGISSRSSSSAQSDSSERGYSPGLRPGAAGRKGDPGKRAQVGMGMTPAAP